MAFAEASRTWYNSKIKNSLEDQLCLQYGCFYSCVSLALLKEQDTFSNRQPALRYIRAQLSAAQCKPIEALKDLCQINVIDSRLFPSELVNDFNPYHMY